MKTKPKMTGEARRESILEAAKPLFALNGFKGTSVRDIAKAADISEALLYQHFPSKKEIFNAVQNYGTDISNRLVWELEEIEPGSEKLITIIYLLFEHILFDVPRHSKEQDFHERFLFSSFLEDGQYAQNHFKNVEKILWPIVIECVQEARKHAQVVEMPVPYSHRSWFVHHLAMALNLCHLPPDPTFAYEGTKSELSESATLFALRGIGLTDEAIRQFYKPDKLKEIKQRIFQKNVQKSSG